MLSQQEIEDRVLQAVTAFVASINAGGRTPAEMEMSPLLEATSCLSLANLEEWERLIRRGAHQANSGQKPSKWRLWSTPTPFPTWIDLCSGDGFKRERTLRALGGPAPNVFFLAIAVRRLNDWVPQVRSAAREKLLSVAIESDPADVANVLCAIFPHWNSWGRMGLADKQVLLDITSIEAVTQKLKAHLSLSAAGPLASVLSQVGRTSALDEHLPELASHAVQPAVRAKAYRALLDGKMAWLEERKWEWTDIRYCKGQLKAVHGERPLAIEVPLAATLTRQICIGAQRCGNRAHQRGQGAGPYCTSTCRNARGG